MRRARVWRVVLAALAALLIATAAAEFDPSAVGSISVRIHTAEGANVEGAHIALYRVGEPVVKDANLTFEPNKDFKGSGETLADLSADGLADRLWRFAQKNGVKPAAEGDTAKDGTLTLKGVTAGLYVVAQEGFAQGKGGFTEIEPFAVSMPMTNSEGTGWTYEITAQPKVGVVAQPTATPAPTDAPTDEKLPQTGMLRWPIPVLAVVGVLLFSLGWALCFMKKKKSDRDA